MDKNYLNTFYCGIEREALRIDKKGKLSKKSHPIELGAPLTHPYISTDFAEAQIEWNTPPFSTFTSAERFMKDLIIFSSEKIQNEFFWPFSMPCSFSKVDIAQYGTSHQGIDKVIYRKGLKDRYGLNLQMISGIHFNFSFPKPFWNALYKKEKTKTPLQDFINKKYLHLIRNFLREGWILTYLFGSSPSILQSYMKSISSEFQKKGNTLYSPWATSIRMSNLGYYSRIQNQHTISFNAFDEYIESMKEALNTPKEEYSQILSQLNNNLLQNENEHYSRIRPKTTPQKGETSLEAMQKRGIEYLEIRSIDIDPYHPIGLNREHISFLHLFLLYCLFKPSFKISKDAQSCLTNNQNLVALKGRKEGLILTEGKPLKQLGSKILNKMMPLAKSLGYDKILFNQINKIKKPNLTPSAYIASDIKKRGMEKMGIALAKLHKKNLLKNKVSSKKHSIFTSNVKTSLTENQKLETSSKILVKGYETLELSTQILIKKALELNINVEVLDWKESFIKLTLGIQVEYVKQATKTSKDCYITSHIFKNKHVTKKILNENGFYVPYGIYYNSIEKALNSSIPTKVVIKPKSTNYGLGITVVEKGDKTSYIKAIKHAFSYENSVIVEEYFSGTEFRFLIINGKVIGVVQREPAHIIGDGKHTIKQLVHLKNHDPTFYRDPKTYLQLGQKEKIILYSQKLSPLSVPQKGKKIYLRHNSNVSTGGDAIDMTDFVHKGYHQIAVKATHIFSAHICGVDIIIRNPKKPPLKGNHVIIEMNYNPVLFFHAFPYKGKKRDVTTELIKLLFKI